jgi:hypothetical protein
MVGYLVTLNNLHVEMTYFDIMLAEKAYDVNKELELTTLILHIKNENTLSYCV